MNLASKDEAKKLATKWTRDHPNWPNQVMAKMIARTHLAKFQYSGVCFGHNFTMGQSGWMWAHFVANFMGYFMATNSFLSKMVTRRIAPKWSCTSNEWARSVLGVSPLAKISMLGQFGPSKCPENLENLAISRTFQISPPPSIPHLLIVYNWAPKYLCFS